jgi:hypothetical protein
MRPSQLFARAGLLALLTLSCSDDSGGSAPRPDATMDGAGTDGPAAAPRLERPTDLLPRPPGDRLPADLFPPAP